MSRIFTLLTAILVSLSMMACSNTSSKASMSQLDSAARLSEEDVETLSPTEGEEAVEEFGPSTEIPEKLTKPIVFDFSAVWCPPCQRFKPVFHSVAKEYKDKARFITVDVDNNQEIARQFQVSSIPQISILKPDGNVVSAMGYMDKADFVKFLDTNL